MNFYIGNSVKEISLREDNIRIRDDLLDYIYKEGKQKTLDMSKLISIDPYDDVEVPKEDLSQIIEICSYIINSSLLENYKKREEGIESVQDLLKMAKQALEMGKGLVSIGD